MEFSTDFDPPIVMAFSDHDPSGASGMQADVETLFSMGCHCSSIATSITSQDTFEYKDSFALDPDIIDDQARAVLEDMLVKVFKVGLVSSVENVNTIYRILLDYVDKPVIFEPALLSLHSQFKLQIIESIQALLLPLSHVVTINSQEAHLLCPQSDTLDACVQEILGSGTEHVLVTNVGKDNHIRTNRLHSDSGFCKEWQWERLPNNYLGSGSTLAASIAAHIAQGFDPVSAIEKAQFYTFNALKHGRRMGMGQFIPNRMFWHQS